MAIKTGKTKPIAKAKVVDKRKVKPSTPLDEVFKDTPVTDEGRIIKLHVSDITVVKGFNTRVEMDLNEDFLSSIKKTGIHQPITVEKIVTKGVTEYCLLGGHRRVAGVSLLEEKHPNIKIEIPAIVKEQLKSKSERNMELLFGNDGKPLTVLEEAAVYTRLKDDGMKDAEIATAAGKSRATVANGLLLDSISPELKEMTRKGGISATLIIDTIRKHKNDVKAAQVELMESIEKAAPAKEPKPETVPKKAVAGEAKKPEPKKAAKPEKVVPLARKAVASAVKTFSMAMLDEVIETYKKMRVPIEPQNDIKALKAYLTGRITMDELINEIDPENEIMLDKVNNFEEVTPVKKKAKIEDILDEEEEQTDEEQAELSDLAKHIRS